MLGFIIIGWPTKHKEKGEFALGWCERCRNKSVWHLQKRRQWLTIFWIPILPLSRANYQAVCEICGVSIELDSEETEQAKELVQKTDAYTNQQIGTDQYTESVNSFWRLVNPELDSEHDNSEVEPPQEAR